MIAGPAPALAVAVRAMVAASIASIAVPLISLKQSFVFLPLLRVQQLLGALDRILKGAAPLAVERFHMLRVSAENLVIFRAFDRADHCGDGIVALLAELPALLFALASAAV